MSSYLQYHQKLTQELSQKIQKEATQSQTIELESEFLNKLSALAKDIHAHDEGRKIGPWLISRIVSHYPQFMEIVPRELLWFFGGDCLHYLGEEEVERFQTLEDNYYAYEQAGKPVDFENLRAEIAGLH